jgi:hypothetical protein
MSIAELRSLSRAEKVKIIEVLWGDLADDAEAFESPAWHGEELVKTELEFAASQIPTFDWEDAKKKMAVNSGFGA